MGPRSWDRGEGVDEGLAKTIGIGFNGAAVLGPRRVPFVSARVVPVMPLQWGRGLGTAGRGDARGHSFASPLASMGPRSWDRGELGLAVLLSRSSWCFNGAAVLGPRRARYCEAIEALRSVLQWGRGLGTAERAARNPKSSRTRRFNGAAVLGPRRAISSATMSKKSPMLQWGRGLGTAERGRRRVL